jgi:hypothetical protein
MGWQMSVSADGGQLVAVFEGELTTEEGIASAEAFRSALAERSLDVVWDLTRMSGYETGAREAWQRVIWPLRGQIRSLKVVGARGLVRVGAVFLALLLGRPWEMASDRGT